MMISKVSPSLSMVLLQLEEVERLTGEEKGRMFGNTVCVWLLSRLNAPDVLEQRLAAIG